MYTGIVWLEVVFVFSALATGASRYGLRYAGAAVAAGMIAGRGVTLLWLATRRAHVGFSWFMASIYARPVLIAAPVFAFGFWLRTVFVGDTWPHIIAGALLIAAVYYTLAFTVGLPPEHRANLRAKVWNRRVELADGNVLR